MTAAPPDGGTSAKTAGRHIEIRGTVQGVGFRPWVYRMARQEGVAGRVSNDAAGVVIDAFGPPASLEAFTARLQTSAPPAASIRWLDWHEIPPEEDAADSGFLILPSRAGEERRLSIPADLATCDDCLRELTDPGDRRYQYPFINCTNCGPRFTLSTGVPYDRPATTMHSFPLCDDCLREYEDPSDRRFHAQPNACPRCGPRLRLLDPAGEEVAADDVLAAAAEALCRGLVVAVKGLGGFHLACDATSREAVERLRARKRRQEKPFAVMVRGLDEARRLADLTAAEARLLQAVERPIVLCRSAKGDALAPAVAPGLDQVGLLLAYSPLHHMLLERAGRPLVMTSGNLSDEPIARTDEEALARLGEIADVFVVHDREIASRADDSVARMVAGTPVLLRRSRGYVPRPIALRRAVERPVLACGAHLKNTFCLAVGDSAYLGPHIGDLEALDTFEAFTEAVAHMERLLSVEAEVIAHDLHPEYLSTVYAKERAGKKVAVQHHHAHVVSAMAEHGLEGPVLGVAYDGVGLGSDGAAWGGEILRADAGAFERLATLRPLALAGGDKAVREVWRLALAALVDAFDGEPPLGRLALFRDVAEPELRVVRQMLAKGVHSPPAHGAGRYFDVAGALVLARRESTYEGQVAMALGSAADPAETCAYRFRVHRSSFPWEIDLRPAWREMVTDLFADVPARIIAARFHNTLAAATAAVVRDWTTVPDHTADPQPVVLTGGCFQNPLLTERLLAELRSATVFLHRDVPPGDGGIALGQALVADAAIRSSAPCV